MTNLEEKFQRFMLGLPSIENIDAIKLTAEERKEEKADYLGLGRSIIFEQKTITTDQADKVQSQIDLHINEDYFPLFYGERDINNVIKNFPNPEEINRRIYTQITKLLEGYLRKANNQIRSTSDLFGISQYSGVLVILNDKVKVLSPEIIVQRIAQRLREEKSRGIFRFSEIAYVILISETHLYKGRDTTSLFTIEGPSSVNCSKSISEYLTYIYNSWAIYNGGNLDTCVDLEDRKVFDNFQEKAEIIPQTVTRSEARAIQYRKHPYMNTWSDNHVLAAGARLLELTRTANSISNPSLSELALNFGDIIVESNIRGLDLKELKKFKPKN